MLRQTLISSFKLRVGMHGTPWEAFLFALSSTSTEIYIQNVNTGRHRHGDNLCVQVLQQNGSLCAELYTVFQAFHRSTNTKLVACAEM